MIRPPRPAHGWQAQRRAHPASYTANRPRGQLPALTEYWVSPDWVEVSYPARADAEGDRLYVEGQSPPQPLAPASYRWYLPWRARRPGAPSSPPATTVATGFASSGSISRTTCQTYADLFSSPVRP